MKLNEIVTNLDRFTGEKMIDYIETNIEKAIKQTILKKPEYYLNKEYAKPFINK